MAATGKTCVNRHKNKHSMISLTTPSDSFDDTTKVTAVVAHYDSAPATPVEYDFKKKTFGNKRRRRIHLKGEKSHRGRGHFDDEPVTGTLQITLETGGSAGPPVDKLTAVVFVDDPDGPDDTP
jgi:predicted RNase H-related nuclease YkuK (DUF458 family)